MAQSTEPEPLVRKEEEIEYEELDMADGLLKGVLLGDEHRTPNFNMRKFVIEPGEEIPKHTNADEHVQYVAEGEFITGIADEEHVVSEGDAVLIPPGAKHWYRNESDDDVELICVVPKSD